MFIGALLADFRLPGYSLRMVAGLALRLARKPNNHFSNSNKNSKIRLILLIRQNLTVMIN